MFGIERLFEGSGQGGTGVVLIGAAHRRAYVRHVLKDEVQVIGELASTDRVALIPDLSPSPDVVVLDCASDGINPLTALPTLSNLDGSPRIVALTEGSFDDGILSSLGADATADIRDEGSLEGAVLDEMPAVHRPFVAA